MKVRPDAGSADDGASGAAGQTPAPDPLAAQAAREVLLSLSRAVQQATIYPPGHPNVAVATRPVVAALGRALERGPHLSLAFTSEGAFAGADTASLQPYDAPWLCHRLVDRGVASIDFATRPTAADAEQLIGWLARGDAMAPGAAAPDFGSCKVGAFDYSRAKFRETRSQHTRTLPVSLAWRTIAGSLAGDWNGSGRQVPSTPVELARFIQDVLDTQEGAGVGELSDRLADVNSLFVGLSDEVKATVKARLVEFVDALTPELRDRVLSASPRDNAGKLDLLGSLADRLPRPRIVDVIRQLRFDRGDSTHQFMVLMLKLTNVASGDESLASALTTHCRQAGMPLPPTELGDANALQALEEMLTQRVNEAASANPIDYQERLEALSTNELRRRLPHQVMSHLGDPSDADAVSGHVGEVAAQLLRSTDAPDDDTAVCVARVQRELPRQLEARRLDALADAAEALAITAARRPTPAGVRTPPELEFFGSPAMIADLLVLIEASPVDETQEPLLALARAGGSTTAEAMLTRLGQHPGRDAAGRIADVLTALDPHVFRSAVAAIYRRTPAISRDLITALLQSHRGKGIGDIARLLLDDEDPAVRADACRLALAESSGSQADAVMSRALQDGDARVVEAAIEAAERHPGLQAATGFSGFLAEASTSARGLLQQRAIRLIGNKPTHATRAILIDALSRRRTRLDRNSRRVSRTLCVALTRLGSADATSAVDVWRRSPAGLVSRLFDRDERLS